MVRPIFALLVVALGPAAHALTVTNPAAPNNGLSASGAGLFMDLTNLTANSLVTVNSFETYASSDAGTAWSFDIYTRPGSYVGHTGSSAGWTLFTSASGTSNGRDATALLDLGASDIAVSPKSTLGVYLVATSGGIRYVGGGATTFADANLQFYSADSRSQPFDGVPFNPRTFAGDVNYTLTPVPEPASMAVLAVGSAALLRRRKKFA